MRSRRVCAGDLRVWRQANPRRDFKGLQEGEGLEKRHCVFDVCVREQLYMSLFAHS